LIAESTPDAAILDVSLGEGSGYPVAECLAERKIPFVFATGHAQQSLAPRFASTPVLVKPFDFADVNTAIDTMIARASARKTHDKAKT
jgi:DNA-binding response OmpR family regulator